MWYKKNTGVANPIIGTQQGLGLSKYGCAPTPTRRMRGALAAIGHASHIEHCALMHPLLGRGCCFRECRTEY